MPSLSSAIGSLGSFISSIPVQREIRERLPNSLAFYTRSDVEIEDNRFLARIARGINKEVVKKLLPEIMQDREVTKIIFDDVSPSWEIIAYTLQRISRTSRYRDWKVIMSPPTYIHLERESLNEQSGFSSSYDHAFPLGTQVISDGAMSDELILFYKPEDFSLKISDLQTREIENSISRERVVSIRFDLQINTYQPIHGFFTDTYNDVYNYDYRPTIGVMHRNRPMEEDTYAQAIRRMPQHGQINKVVFIE